MALSDRLKWDLKSDDEIVWKYPSEEILIGSQLVVGEGQEAFFVKGGELLDNFLPGTHTLITANLPLLNKLINLPFDKKTPFTAEVWFINKLTKMDIKWGTKSPIQVMDNVLQIPVSVRSFGRWGYKVTNGSRLIKKITGTQSGIKSERVSEYLYGFIAQSLSETIANEISAQETSILNVATKLSDLSSLVQSQILNSVKEIGLDVINFNIESINIPDDELKKIQSIYEKTLEARELSKTKTSDSYTTIRSLDIMDKAASNDSGTGQGLGAMLGAGLGIGAGLPLGQKIGESVNSSSKSEGKTSLGDKLRELKSLFDEGLITDEQFNKAREQILNEMKSE